MVKIWITLQNYHRIQSLRPLRENINLGKICMNQSNPNLMINLEDYKEFFISADISKDGSTLVVNMNITGIKLLGKILDQLKESSSIDASKILIRSQIDGFTPLVEFMLYKTDQNDEPYTFSINYSFMK